MSKKDKHGRKRVSREAMRDNAASSGRTGSVPLSIPSGARLWEPDKAKTYDLNFIPYEITDPNHPEDKNGSHEPGTMWWKRGFFIHRDIGVDGNIQICPTSIGKPCPICEYRKRLTKDWTKNEAEIKSLNYQKWVAYSILDPDDDDKGAVYATSAGKFARTRGGIGIDAEIEELP